MNTYSGKIPWGTKHVLVKVQARGDTDRPGTSPLSSLTSLQFLNSTS